MNLQADVRPGSSNAKVIAALTDGQWHSHVELREATGLHKSQLSAAIHRLRFYYGYIIEVNDIQRAQGPEGMNSNKYRLVGRYQAVAAHQVPALGTTLEVVGHYMNGARTEVILRSSDGSEWRVPWDDKMAGSWHGAASA